MYLYNVGMGVWQYSYTFHIANFAEVSTGEMVFCGQKVLEIMIADGLCLVLSSYCTVSHEALWNSEDCKQENVIGFSLI